MFHPSKVQDIWMILVVPRHSSNAVRRQKFVLVQHVAEDAAKLLAVDDRHQPALALTRREHASLVIRITRPVGNKPIETPLETRQLVEKLGLKSIDSE